MLHQNLVRKWLIRIYGAGNVFENVNVRPYDKNGRPSENRVRVDFVVRDKGNRFIYFDAKPTKDGIKYKQQLGFEAMRRHGGMVSADKYSRTLPRGTQLNAGIVTPVRETHADIRRLKDLARGTSSRGVRSRGTTNRGTRGAGTATPRSPVVPSGTVARGKGKATGYTPKTFAQKVENPSPAARRGERGGGGSASLFVSMALSAGISLLGSYIRGRLIRKAYNRHMRAALNDPAIQKKIQWLTDAYRAGRGKNLIQSASIVLFVRFEYFGSYTSSHKPRMAEAISKITIADVYLATWKTKVVAYKPAFVPLKRDASGFFGKKIQTFQIPVPVPGAQP